MILFLFYASCFAFALFIEMPFIHKSDNKYYTLEYIVDDSDTGCGLWAVCKYEDEFE
jgi:hypothetical protein